MTDLNDLFDPIDRSKYLLDLESMPIRGFWENASKSFCKNKTAMAGSILLLVIFVMSIVGPYINFHTYHDIHLSSKNEPPSTTFWFGTDELGRDIFTRVWRGARISLFVGITATIIDLIIGVVWGTISGLIGGIVDDIMMRICDILNAIPYLLMVILLTVIIGPGLWTIIGALTLTGWINMSRIVRAQILQIKEQEFIFAAVALGASKRHIITSHLIPNAIGPIIVTMTMTISIAIFTEAFLSFLGLGVQAPIASWGVMASDGLSALRYYPWRLFFPAAMISITMLGFNLVSDGLRDALDPKLRS